MSSFTPDLPALPAGASSSWWERWPSWEMALVQPADARAVLLSVSVGAAFDVAIRSGVVTLAGALGFAVAGLGLLLSGRLTTSSAKACAVAAVVLGAFLAVRTTPWLIPFDILGAVALLGVAAMLARDGSLSNLSAALLTSRAVLALVHAFASLGFMAHPFQRWLQRGDAGASRRIAGRVAVGFVLAAPVVIVIGALLASADRIFASMVSVDLDLSPSLAGHLVLIGIGTVGFSSLLRLASARPSEAMPSVGWQLGAIEWTVLLGSVTAVLALFAGVQAFAMAGGGREVLETEGLTYAQYARSGYFQLLAVTAVVGGLIGVVGPWCGQADRGERRRFVGLAGTTLALTGVVLVVALYRLGLYEDAYGWTMLRLMAKAGAVWIAVVLVLLGIRVAGVARDRAWFLPAAAGAGLALLVALNLANPEAMVARHNVARAAGGAEADAHYLAGLSDDAVPTVVDGIDRLPADARAEATASLCPASVTAPGAGEDEESGVLSWNWASDRAEAALAKLCGESRSR